MTPDLLHSANSPHWLKMLRRWMIVWVFCRLMVLVFVVTRCWWLACDCSALPLREEKKGWHTFTVL